MKKKSLIIIIVILSFVLVAGVVWCITLSIGEKNPAQEETIETQDTVTDPTKETGEDGRWFATESSEEHSFPDVTEGNNAEEEEIEQPTNQTPDSQETEIPTQGTEPEEPTQGTEPEEPTQGTEPDEPNETNPSNPVKRGENETGRV